MTTELQRQARGQAMKSCFLKRKGQQLWIEDEHFMKSLYIMTLGLYNILQSFRFSKALDIPWNTVTTVIKGIKYGTTGTGKNDHGGCQKAYSNIKGASGISGKLWLCSTCDNNLFLFFICLTFWVGFHDRTLFL